MVQGFCEKTHTTERMSQVKESSTNQASHVNSGTAVWSENRRRQNVRGSEFRHPRLEPELERSDSSAYAGLSLAVSLLKSLGVTRRIDSSLDLLRSRRPYSESDHVLAHVYNLYLGGTCLEDISVLQGSEAVRRMLGARTIPDPTTAGDFLRRFDADSLDSLNSVIDDAQSEVWTRRYGKTRRKVAYVDIDSHVKHIYGSQKEGADFTYKGGYGFHPLAITLGETQEVLRLLNRWGNVTSADGAVAELDKVFPLLAKHFQTIIVRGDAAFAQQEIFDICEEHEQYFAVVSPQQRNFERMADSLPQTSWKPFGDNVRQEATQSATRKRGKNLRRHKARGRGKRDLKLKRQWVAEVPYQPDRSQEEFRLVIRRQRIEESNQGQLFTVYRYRFALTNLPSSYSAEEVMRLTYRRCDQENVVEFKRN